MSLMNYDEAFNRILVPAVEANIDTFGNKDGFLEHSYDVGTYAKKLAEDLGYSRADAKLVGLAGLLHDYGRGFVLDKTHNLHEIKGAYEIEKNGVSLGLASSQDFVSRIAQAFRPHFIVSEQVSMPLYDNWKVGLEIPDSALLVPATVDEYLVAYSDLTNGGTVNAQERIDKMDASDSKSGNPRVIALRKAKGRLISMESRILSALKSGSLEIPYSR